MRIIVVAHEGQAKQQWGLEDPMSDSSGTHRKLGPDAVRHAPQLSEPHLETPQLD